MLNALERGVKGREKIHHLMVRKVFSHIVLLCAALAIITVFSGCRAGYVMHAAVGEIRLLSNAVPVQQVLADGSLNPSQKERVLLVSQIKEFGEKELGLKKTSSYETIYMGSAQSPIYTVAAAPKDKLTLKTWWFPVVGRVPYLGFFDLAEAQDEKQKLLQDDLDVIIGRAEAFSTLGWFSDPLTLNLIDGSEVDLAEIILHEMTHTTLYVKGQGEFNEGLAQIVGKWGAFLFFEKTRGPSHPQTIEAMASIEDERLFSSFLASVLDDLQRLYASTLPLEEKLREREKVFMRCRESFEDLKSHLKSQRFVHFGQAPLNNAYLMAVSLYHRNFPLFEAVLKRDGYSVRDMLLFFRGLSEQEGNLLEMTRKRLEK
jgi:predicted aminopeptidase